MTYVNNGLPVPLKIHINSNVEAVAFVDTTNAVGIMLASRDDESSRKFQRNE